MDNGALHVARGTLGHRHAAQRRQMDPRGRPKGAKGIQNGAKGRQKGTKGGFVEFGPCPIYAHGSSFLPNPGIMIMIMMMMVSRAEIIIIIVNRIINYNCNSHYNLLNLDLVLGLFQPMSPQRNI